jgi:hypothetical protein
MISTTRSKEDACTGSSYWYLMSYLKKEDLISFAFCGDWVIPFVASTPSKLTNLTSRSV